MNFGGLPDGRFPAVVLSTCAVGVRAFALADTPTRDSSGRREESSLKKSVLERNVPLAGNVHNLWELRLRAYVHKEGISKEIRIRKEAVLNAISQQTHC